MKNKNFIEKNKGVLISALKSLILYLLKMQTMGGFKGWLIKTLVTEFAEEVVDTVNVVVDYVEIKRKVKDTAENENRNEATDVLNSTFNS